MKAWSIRIQKWGRKDDLHQNLCALALIALVVLLGNAVYTTGFRNPDPVLQFSGLGTAQSGALLGGLNAADPNIAYTAQALGTQAAHQLLSGHMPYWNHYEGVGSPLAGEMQSAALLPTTLLLVLPNGVLYEHIILEIVAGYFTYLFIKQLGLRARVALLAGTVFALNGTFAWLTNAAFNPVAFLPMILYGLESLFAQETKNRMWLWLPVGLALSLYAGFPETAFIDGMLVGVWTLGRLWQMWPHLTRQLLLKLGSGFVVGILLAAPILVLFADYLPYANVGGHNNGFAYLSLSRAGLPSLIFPYIYGPVAGWDKVVGDGGYITITVVLLAIIGLFSHIDAKIKSILLFWVVACLLKAYGFRPAEVVWNLVPTIKGTAFYRYYVPSLIFACIVLAAYGLEDLLARALSRRRFLYSYVVFGTIFVIAVAIAARHLPLVVNVPHSKLYAAAAVLWACVIAAQLAAVIIVVKRKFVYGVVSLLVVGDTVLMFALPTLSTPTVLMDSSPVHFLQSNLGTTRFYTLGPIQPNYGSYYDISQLNVNDLPVPKAWGDYITGELDTNTSPLLFTGQFRLSAGGSSTFDEFLKNEQNYEYIGTKYLVAGRNQLTDNQISAANLIIKHSSAAADIYQLPQTAPYYQTLGGCRMHGSTAWDTAKVDCVSSGGVVRKELFMPGWKVSIDGTTTDVREYDNLFQAAALPKGHHTLTFTFSPPHILEAWLLLATGLAAMTCGLFPTKVRTSIRRLKAAWNRNWG